MEDDEMIFPSHPMEPEPGFIRATSQNLPKLELQTFTTFFFKNTDYLSTLKRDEGSLFVNYGDPSIGYVQFKKNSTEIVIKSVIKIDIKAENCSVTLTLKDNEVISITCSNCKENCYHGLALLFWLHRRSEEQSQREMINYWQKPQLDTKEECLTTSEFDCNLEPVQRDTPCKEKDDQNIIRTHIVNEFIKLGVVNPLVRYSSPLSKVQSLSLHLLMLEYKISLDGNGSAHKFLNMCGTCMDEETCGQVEKETKGRFKSNLWMEMRYARITPAKLYYLNEVIYEEDLIQWVMGEKKLKPKKEIKRIETIQGSIKIIIEEHTKKTFSPCGAILNGKHPFLIACPDFICDDLIVDIKCPPTENVLKKYLSSEQCLNDKYNDLINLQMYIADKKAAIVCIAYPDFEKSRKLTIFNVEYDQKNIEKYIYKGQSFWIRHIFPLLIS